MILHLRVLWGGDRLAALVQWLAYAGVSPPSRRSPRELGATRRGRVLAVVFAGTLPMAVLQSSSTQNDLVAGLWALTALVFWPASIASPGWLP